MGKAAAPSKRQTTVKKSDPGVDYFGMFDARSRLLSSMSSLGWRMGVMIIVPLIVGLKLDEHYGTKPSYTLTAFFISIAGCGYLIYQEYKEINAEMNETYAPKDGTTDGAKKKEDKV